jgi:hypothetical protein
MLSDKKKTKQTIILLKLQKKSNVLQKKRCRNETV